MSAMLAKIRNDIGQEMSKHKEKFTAVRHYATGNVVAPLAKHKANRMNDSLVSNLEKMFIFFDRHKWESHR